MRLDDGIIYGNVRFLSTGSTKGMWGIKRDGLSLKPSRKTKYISFQ